MKSLLFLLLMLLIAVFTEAQSPQSAATTTTYSDTVHHFSLQIPVRWIPDRSHASYAAVFYPNEPAAHVSYKSNFNIAIYNIAGNKKTLKEHTDYSLKVIDIFTDRLVVHNTEGTTVSGLPGHMVIFSGNQFGKSLKYCKAWTIKDSTLYHMTFTSRPEVFDSYLATVRQMIQSFTILEKPSSAAPH
jgi:hypothetical protein